MKKVIRLPIDYLKSALVFFILITGRACVTVTGAVKKVDELISIKRQIYSYRRFAVDDFSHRI